MHGNAKNQFSELLAGQHQITQALEALVGQSKAQAERLEAAITAMGQQADNSENGPRDN